MAVSRLILRLVLWGCTWGVAAPLGAQSLMERWRRGVEPELGVVERRLGVLRTEQARLPEAMSRPDLSQLGYRSLPEAMPVGEKWVQVDLGDVVPVDDIVLIPAVIPSVEEAAVSVGFPKRFRVTLSSVADFGSFETVADFSDAAVPDPGPMPVVVGRGGRAARYVRVTALELRGDPDNYFFALGELVVTSGNQNRAQGAAVTALDELVSPRWSVRALTDGISAVGRPVERRLLPTNGYHGAIESTATVTQWVQVDLGESLALDEIRLVPARPVDFADTIGFGFPVRFRVEVADDATMARPTVIADHSAADFPNPGDRRVVLAAGGARGRYVRVTALELWQRRQPGDYVFALAELEVVSAGANVASERPVTESSPLGPGHHAWSPEFLVDGIAPREGVGTYAEWLSAFAQRYVVDAEIGELEKRAAVLRELADRQLLKIASLGAAGIVGAAGAGLWWARWRQSRQMRRLRARIARDLHDDIGSNLGSIALMAQLGVEAASEPAAMRGELEEIRRVATQTADSMHDIVWLISPGMRTTGDLAARLRETAGQLLGGLDWSMEVLGSPGRRGPSIDVQRDLFLVFKEALHNIRRHAGDCRVTISLEQSRGGLTLRIADDGAGFEIGGARRGQGLSNMERRAAECGGRLTVESSTGRGTVVVLDIPVP